MMLKTFQEMGLNPKGDNLTELDQKIKDLYQRMNCKMSNQMFPITFINRKTSITRTNSTILLLYFLNVRNFSGGDNRRETAYNIWRCEVKMLMKESGYTKQQKDYAIRRS